ncbi:MAG: metallophosphoesterase family protein [Planctomycetes bacterium]|nr:metallophosphoesterase family protein [Planctomycetota bacterium]
MPRTAFEPDLADRMIAIGAVETRSARLWLRTDVPGRHEVRYRAVGDADWQRRGVDVDADPARDNIAIAELTGLDPDTRYEVAVERPADELQPRFEVGRGGFATAPEVGTSGRFTIAAMSCNQPFDDRGRIRPEASAMLRAANTAMHELDARLVLMMGDQMYADQPVTRSLYDPDFFATVAPAGETDIRECDAAQIRRIFQERHRLFWSMPEWRELLANRPCYPMLDDHEILDNWGSDPAHDEPSWQPLREGALRAYHDYQGSRVRSLGAELPTSFCYEFAFGDVAGLVTDMRTARSFAAGRVLGREQLDRVRAFLTANVVAPVALLVTPLPLFHVSAIAAELGAAITPAGDDLSDRLIHPAFADEYRELCATLRDHRRRAPAQRLLLLGGDIHVGAACALRWDDGPEFHQFVASGVTHESPLASWVSGLAVREFAAHDRDGDGTVPTIRLLACKGDGAGNPFRGLHVGFVEIDLRPTAPAGLELSLLGMVDGKPDWVFRSGPI